MRFNTRFAAASVAALTMLLATACSGPAAAPQSGANPPASGAVTNPPAGDSAPVSPEDVDVAVRKVLTDYLDGLNAGNYGAAADYWSPASSAARPSKEMYEGVSDWHFISSEMIDGNANEAFVQLNFNVKVTGKAPDGLTDGRNTWFVRLSTATGEWKIMSISFNP